MRINASPSSIKKSFAFSSFAILVFSFLIMFPSRVWADSAPAISADIASSNASKVNLTITYPSGSNIVSKLYSVDGGSTWNNYTAPISSTSNGTIMAKYQVKSWIIYPIWSSTSDSDIATYTVNNILDPNNGSWAENNVTMKNTPEADMMVRVGDISNFTYGFNMGFNPFSGNSTQVHGFPWTPPTDSSDGTDRIMVNSGYKYNSSVGTDGYTSSSLDSNHNVKAQNKVRDIVMQYNLSGIKVNNAILQMFVDDFQAGGKQPDSNSNFYQFKGSYKATINGLEIPELERTINNLNQSGPIGRMITINITDNAVLDRTIRTGKIAVNIDCKDSTYGDGYAIDFVKLLINPVSLDQTSTITGTVKDKNTGALLSGVNVSSDSGITAVTDANGSYTLSKVPAGAPTITASKSGYVDNTTTLYTSAKNTYTLNFDMASTQAPGKPQITESPMTLTNQNVQVSAVYPDNPAKTQISIVKNSSTTENWVNYTGALTVGSDWTSATDTWTVKAKSQSASGVWSDVSVFTINNIDKSKPAAPILSASPTTTTSGSVIVTATFPSTGVKAGSQQISIDGGLSYVPYTGTVTLTDNATVMAKYQNNAGTDSFIAILNVSNIDKTKPGKPTLSDTHTTLQDGTVAAIVTANFPNNPPVMKISIDNGATWNNYSGTLTITSNTTVLAKSQNALGTWSDISDPLVLNYIKTGKPVLTENNTAPTNRSVNISISYPNSAVVRKYKIDNGAWIDYSGPISISKNCVVTAVCYDNAGTSSDTGTINVTNIDTTAPTAQIGVIRTNVDGSKIVGFTFTSEAVTVNSMTSNPMNSGEKTGEQEYTCYASSTITFSFTDAAGNVGTASCEVKLDNAIPINPKGNKER